MINKIGAILGGTAILVAGVILGVVIVKEKKIDEKIEENEKCVKKAAGLIDKAVKDVADATPVEVKDDIVRRAVDRAVDREVSSAVGRSVSQVRMDIEREINSQVRNEIQKERDSIVDRVDKKLVEEVDRISREDIARDVQRKITNLMIDRMDSDLKEIRDKYERKMDENMSDLTRKYRKKMDDLDWDYDRYRVIYKI